ncbi:MAG TPA: oligosaccharide flippase family protein, partial [Pyrinomonadaceae bacterium]|nr:oligosaccharide flippase family protein [Pyrinomonadaceae bacterium]
VRTAALIALLTSVPVAAMVMIFAASIVGLFNVPADYIADATLALRLASATFVINFFCGIFNTPQLARLRMDLNTMVNAVPRILGLIATPIIIYLGFGVVGAITILLIVSVAILAGHLIFSRRLLPHLSGSTIDKTMLRPMVKLGISVVFLGLAGLVLFNVEKGILAATMPVKVLAYYSVAMTLAGMMILLSNNIIQSLVPAFSQLSGTESVTHLRSLFIRIVKLSLIILIPAAAFFCLTVRDFLTIWIGEEFALESATPFFILLTGLLFSVPGYVPYSLLMAQGRANAIAKLYWIEIVPYILLVLVLTLKFGIIGAAAAWSARVAFDGTVFFLLIKRSSKFSVDLIEDRLAWVIASVLVYLPVVTLSLLGYHALSTMSISIFIIATGIYSALIWKRALTSEERGWIKSSVGQRAAIIGFLRLC